MEELEFAEWLKLNLEPIVNKYKTSYDAELEFTVKESL